MHEVWAMQPKKVTLLSGTLPHSKCADR